MNVQNNSKSIQNANALVPKCTLQNKTIRKAYIDLKQNLQKLK